MKKKIALIIGYTIAALIFIIFIFVFMTQFVTGVITIALIIAACLSKAYKRITKISVGFELVTPVVIILAYKFDILFSIVVSLIMIFVSDFLSGDISSPALIWQSVAYTIMCIAAAMLGSIDFILLGISLVVFRNVFLFVAGILWGGANPMKIFISNFPNIFINSFIIVLFAGYVLPLL